MTRRLLFLLVAKDGVSELEQEIAVHADRLVASGAAANGSVRANPAFAQAIADDEQHFADAGAAMRGGFLRPVLRSERNG